ncbi:MAG: FAD:protein FMN transferase [Acidobacteriota bacterium]
MTIRRQVAAMGTVLTMDVASSSRTAALAASEAAVRAVAAVEARLSTWRLDSELAALNRHPVGQPFPLSPQLAADLELAAQLWRLTGGAFDPGIGALLQAWDVRGPGRRPSRRELAAARRASGMALLALARGTAVRLHPALRLEEGGFGKGVGLDAALEALRGAGALAALLDFGGQVAVLPAAEGYEVAIAHPHHRTLEVGRLRLHRGSLATSGNGQRRRGRPHLFDPRTGKPAKDFGSVSVWAPTAAEADALATGLFVLGPEGALAWAERYPAYGVLVVELRGNSFRLRASPALAAGRLPATVVPVINQPTSPPEKLGSPGGTW